MFMEKVVPRIHEALGKYEEKEKTETDLGWKLNLQYVDKLSNDEIADLETMKKVHADILAEEQTATNIHLVVTYHRGLLYLNARKFVPKDANVKEWFCKEFSVAYATVERYQRFAMLISAYPRLLVCGLCFAQFAKHHNHMLNHLDDDKELACQLKSHVTVSVQGKGIDVIPGVQSVPGARNICLNPDYVYEEDAWYEPYDGDYLDVSVTTEDIDDDDDGEDSYEMALEQDDANLNQ